MLLPTGRYWLLWSGDPLNRFWREIADWDLDQVYDVTHNIAKIEDHNIGGSLMKLVVHRKGATRAFPPGSSELHPVSTKKTGQPVLVPGSMGTPSYVLVGTQKGFESHLDPAAMAQEER